MFLYRLVKYSVSPRHCRARLSMRAQTWVGSEETIFCTKDGPVVGRLGDGTEARGSGETGGRLGIEGAAGVDSATVPPKCVKAASNSIDTPVVPFAIELADHNRPFCPELGAVIAIPCDFFLTPKQAHMAFCQLLHGAGSIDGSGKRQLGNMGRQLIQA